MQHFSWIGEIVVSFFDVINRLKNVSPISSRLENCIIGDSRNESCQFVKKKQFFEDVLIWTDYVRFHQDTYVHIAWQMFHENKKTSIDAA